MSGLVQKGYLQQYGAIFVSVSALVDAFVISMALYFVCYVNGRVFNQEFMLILLTTLLVYLVLGVLYSLYRSWRLSSIAQEL